MFDKPKPLKRERYDDHNRNLILCAILLYAIGSCTTTQPRGRITVPPNIADEYQALTVEIEADCAIGNTTFGVYGSGVIVSPEHVVTALHVVKCGNDKSRSIGMTIKTVDGNIYKAVAEQGDPVADVARVRITEGLFTRWARLSPDLGAALPVGSVLCHSTGRPERTVKCGVVDLVVTYAGRVRTTGVVVPGNSGSGVFNSDRELVGIAVARTDDARSYALIDYRIQLANVKHYRTARPDLRLKP